MNCKNCGQEMSHHHYSYHNSDANQCDIEIVECANCQIEEPAELAALREVGEKMAAIYTHLPKELRNELNVYYQILLNGKEATELMAALAEWEAANK